MKKNEKQGSKSFLGITMVSLILIIITLFLFVFAWNVAIVKIFGLPRIDLFECIALLLVIKIIGFLVIPLEKK